MLRNRAVLILAGIFLAVFSADLPRAAAAEWVYEISLRPTAAGLERTFSGWEDFDRSSTALPDDRTITPNGRLPDEKLADLAKLYSDRLTKPHELRQKFRGVFPGRMPDDFGGRGDYLVYASPLGSSYVYLERFRGHGDIDLALLARREAVDALVDILRDWIDDELADSPRRAEVRRFFHQELRQDLRNLSLLPLHEAVEVAGDGQSLASREGEKAVVETMLNRVLQYGLERGYFDAADLAELRLLFLDVQLEQDAQEVVRIFHRSLIRKTRLDATSAGRVSELFDDDGLLMKSLAAHVRLHPEFKRFAERPDDGVVNSFPDEARFLGELVSKAFDFDFNTRTDHLEISLKTPEEPFSTNGQIDPVSRTTTRWSRDVDDQAMPTLCYAHWSVPDEDFQFEHFGKVVADDSSLAAVATLFARLTLAQQAELTKHLESLERGDTLRERLTRFTFVGPPDEKAEAVAETLLELLSREL
jgi:hypothetical protein